MGFIGFLALSTVPAIVCTVRGGWNPVTCISQTPLPTGPVRCCQCEALVGKLDEMKERPFVLKFLAVAVAAMWAPGAVSSSSNSTSGWGSGQFQQHQQLHTLSDARHFWADNGAP